MENPRVTDYRSFIEENFLIIDKYNRPVPFKFNSVQNKVYELWKTGSASGFFWPTSPRSYPVTLDGLRENILKARQEGVSSLVLAMFTVDFLTLPFSGSICISHRDADTRKLFKKVHFFVQSFCAKHKIDIQAIYGRSEPNPIEIVNVENGSCFWVATAGTKVGGRGTTAKNILFSEAAFYPDTAILRASEIVEGTAQQVAQDYGMIIIECTANGYGNYFHQLWKKCERGLSEYKSLFLSYRDNPEYTDEWIEKKRRSFVSLEMAKQEYPETPLEAFIMSGDNFFDKHVLDYLYKRAEKKQPIYKGDLNVQALSRSPSR